MRRNATPPETVFWNLVRGKRLGPKFRRQAPVLGYIADFYAPRLLLVVELDGPAHHAHDVGAAWRQRWDAARDAQLDRYGYEVLRFSNDDVRRNPHLVVAHLRAIIAQRQQALVADGR